MESDQEEEEYDRELRLTRAQAHAAGSDGRWPPIHLHRRRSLSEDIRERSFLVDLERTQRLILHREDTLGHEKVTIDDCGPKHIQLPIIYDTHHPRLAAQGSPAPSTFSPAPPPLAGGAGLAAAAAAAARTKQRSLIGAGRKSITGNYMISSLLQELALYAPETGALVEPPPAARLPLSSPAAAVLVAAHTVSGATEGVAERVAQAYPPPRTRIVLSTARLNENPLERLNRMITMYYWPSLVRRIDADGIRSVCGDEKNRGPNKQLRIYIPPSDERAARYFKYVQETHAHLDLEIVTLPPTVTPAFLCAINDKPGILALDLEWPKQRPQPSSPPDPAAQDIDYSTVRGKPFIVPGGRFNEMYGWDSYFSTLGLLADDDRSGRTCYLPIAKAMVENHVYQIEHYGKILNANRSYYLLRSQPPLFTDMALSVYRALVRSRERRRGAPSPAMGKRQGVIPDDDDGGNDDDDDDDDLEDWLRAAFMAAIKEYTTVWMVEPRFIPHLCLNRYYAEGKGVPPETEATHFDSQIAPRAAAAAYASKEAYIAAYNRGDISDAALDEYFMHDRAVRESGHDTTYRLDGRAAHLATIDINALLYKYEVDIATYLQGHPIVAADPAGGARTHNIYRPEYWIEAASRRREAVNRLLWCEKAGMYFDYDIKQGMRSTYESATAFWPLWAEMASPQQAAALARHAQTTFNMRGGLVSGSKASISTTDECGALTLGTVSLDRPNRQWDYPYGWAPHQILAWAGLRKYGYGTHASRLAYKWLYMILRAFSDFNGVVPEKFDVVNVTHKVSVEYGNVGADFKKVAREGFAWMNASILIGQTHLDLLELRSLGALVPPATLEGVKAQLLSNKSKRDGAS